MVFCFFFPFSSFVWDFDISFHNQYSSFVSLFLIPFLVPLATHVMMTSSPGLHTSTKSSNNTTAILLGIVPTFNLFGRIARTKIALVIVAKLISLHNQSNNAVEI